MTAAAVRPRVERIGHRGAPREYVENTIPSFARAIALGADAIELDVHVTADGIPVVHHDPTLGRGIEPRELRGRALDALTAGQIASVRLRHGASLPTLAEVLQAIGRRARVYVEIKSGAETAVAAVIRAADAACAVHSFDHEAIARFAAVAPDIPRGLLFERRPVALAEAMRACRARDVWAHFPLIDAGLVREAHGIGCRVLAWTVDDPGEAARLVALEVDGICTNDLTPLPPLGAP